MQCTLLGHVMSHPPAEHSAPWTWCLPVWRGGGVALRVWARRFTVARRSHNGNSSSGERPVAKPNTSTGSREPRVRGQMWFQVNAGSSWGVKVRWKRMLRLKSCCFLFLWHDSLFFFFFLQESGSKRTQFDHVFFVSAPLSRWGKNKQCVVFHHWWINNRSICCRDHITQAFTHSIRL